MRKIILIAIFTVLMVTQVFAYEVSDNLYKALIAEDTSGDYQTYLAIASCVRNRLNKGMTHGLVAMKRKDLDAFMKREITYAHAVKNIDLESQAKRAIREVFILNKDYANGATHYEHTGKYKKPKWAKDMRIVKVLHKGTKKEITFWRRK